MAQSQIPLTPHWTINPATGTATFRPGGRTLLDKVSARVSYTVGDSRCRGSSPTTPLPTPAQTHHFTLYKSNPVYGVATGSVDLRARDGQVELNWQLRANSGIPGAVAIRVEVTNVGRETVYLDELRPLTLDAAQGGQLDLGTSPDEWSFYMHGWQSWSPVFARHVADGMFSEPAAGDYLPKHVPHVVPPHPHTLTSEWVGVLTLTPSSDPQSLGETGVGGDPGRGLLLGFVTAKNQLSEIRLWVEEGHFAGLAAICHTDGVPLAPGECLASESLLVATGKPYTLLETWADELGRFMGARIPRQVPTGWCTWYYFFGLNSAHDILANLAQIKQHRLPLDWVVIDDGYVSAIGDWLLPDQRRFPEGMDGLARQIMAAGFRPALWIAPFGASRDSQLYAGHPDWILRDAAGEPVIAWEHTGVPIYALDVTHPGVQNWLSYLFQVLSHDWGYAGFKIDFVFAAALPGRRHDPRMTRAQAFRRGLEIIREAIGERFLLGCGAPIGPSVGLVDAMRIGPDVFMMWKSLWEADLSAPAVANAVRNILTRALQHNRFWINDPDCLLVRGRSESALSLAEIRTLASVIALSGGMVLASDNFPTLKPASRIDILRQILPPLGQAATPIDLFEHEQPRLFALNIERQWGRWCVVGAINWSDRIARTTIDLARLGFRPYQAVHVYDFWHRRYLGVVRGNLSIPRQLPHETTLLLLKLVSEQPDFLASTFHVTQGAVEVQHLERRRAKDDQLSLVIHLQKSGRQYGQLLFTVPPDWQAITAKVNGRPVRRLTEIADGVVGVRFWLEGDATFEITFAGQTEHETL